MRAWLLAAVLMACGAAAGGGGTTALRKTPCMDRALAQTEEQQAKQRNRAALEAAIAARGLTLVPIEPVYLRTDESAFNWETQDGYALAPAGYRACGVSPRHDLARDAEGGIWAIVPVPNVSGQRELHACGCYGDDPVTCGGAAAEPVVMGYPIPAGFTFRGQTEIQYTHEVVSVFLVGRADGSECPPRPDPPP